jgi:ADP-ribose pyrophosphatase YjhB (NUDIX family)
MEINETPAQNIVKEVYEETNYIIKPSNIIAQSLVVSSTQMNECVYSFVVDITHCKKASKKTGDGTIFEDVSKNT